MYHFSPAEVTGMISRSHEVMRDRGLTQQDIADIMGVSRQTVARWLSSESHGAPARLFLGYCATLDISPTWLAFGVGPKHLSQITKD